MLYKEDVIQALSYLQKIHSKFNKIYKYHKLDRDVCAKEIAVVQKVLEKVLDMDELGERQKRLFEEE